ncbi:MAG: hypothetical protein K2I13_00230 [Alistipes sp.]|nr:hypothetical protein [Alistipes sp.]
MKRILIWLAAAAALTGCRIEEAEYFDPTQEGLYMFREANRSLGETAAVATRVLLFDLYYSASEEEREVVHNRYFYSSRIVISDDGCHIIDGSSDLIIYTGGQPLSTEGTDRRYAYSSQSYLESEMPTISCRKNETGPDTYDFRFPDSDGQWSVTPFYCNQPQPDGPTRYWCELRIKGTGRSSEQGCFLDFGTVAYEILEPLKYNSEKRSQFQGGKLKLTATIDHEETEATAKYIDDDHVVISYGSHAKTHWY